MSKPVSSKLPWYPWCPRDFASDPAVMQMSDMEELMYRRLLDYQFLAGAVPTDLPSLAKAARMPVPTAGRLWSRVSAQFPNGVNGRMSRQVAEAESYREKKVNAGRIGNVVRHQCDTSATPESIANARHTYTQTHTDTKEEKNSSGAREDFLRSVPVDNRDALAAAFRASHHPDALLASLKAIVSGLTPPAYPPAVIGQAVQEMAVAGAKMSVNTLRAFCRKIVAGDTPPTPLTLSPSDRVFAAAAELDRRAVA